MSFGGSCAPAKGLVVGEVLVSECNVVHGALACRCQPQRAEQHIDDSLRCLDVSRGHGAMGLGVEDAAVHEAGQLGTHGADFLARYELQEVLGMRPLSRVFHAPPVVAGVMNLRGDVLPVGGIKEKVLAALRAGITEVLLPAENERDLADLAPSARKKLKFIFVSTVDEVLRVAIR